MNERSKALASWLREPLLQFLVIGALLFLAFQWWGGGGSASSRIVITPGEIDSIVTGFTRTWQRPPTEQELKAQLDERVREEIAAREATAMGLDRDDTIIRRRLRQKFEFLTESGLDARAPTDAQLQAWLAAHSDLFRSEPELAFRQVYLSPERRGARLESDAHELLAQLSKSGPDVEIDKLGDTLMLPQELGRTTQAEVARTFGDGFAEAILKVEPGRWVGPVRSGYGLHLVLVREREAARNPTLAEVRPQVEREFTADRQRRELDALYARLLQRYQVMIEKRPEIPPAAVANASPKVVVPAQ
jgi:uncharacterized coiled-coil protein SlyX